MTSYRKVPQGTEGLDVRTKGRKQGVCPIKNPAVPVLGTDVTGHKQTLADLNIKNGEKVRALLPYGIGIDCHSQFIQVCVLVQTGREVRQFEAEFETRWDTLCQARNWAFLYATQADRNLALEDMRYTIESTGTYHMPVLLAWRGVPSVVNPVLAGATRRKTDVLDARLLAHHSLVGLWPRSFIPNVDAELLRVMMGMRFEAGRNATRASNRINNHVLRFGHTFGKDHSMADPYSRGVIEDMCKGIVPQGDSVCPEGLPEASWPFFTQCYALYDQFSAMRHEYHNRALTFVKERTWPTNTARIGGKDLLHCLVSVPGVGEVTALTWLSVVCDPARFQHAKQVAAFCGSDPSLKVSAGKVTQHVKRKGNARLHHALKNVAAQLVRRRAEPFGCWGFAMMKRHSKGGWARAINAISRRLGACMWYVHGKGEVFSYEKYKFFEVPAVIDVPIKDMDLGSRYERLLIEAGLSTSQEVARAFQSSLPQQKGIGAGCLQKVKKWLDANRLLKEPEKSTDSSSSAESSGGRKRTSRTKTAEKFASV